MLSWMLNSEVAALCFFLKSKPGWSAGARSNGKKILRHPVSLQQNVGFIFDLLKV